MLGRYLRRVEQAQRNRHVEVLELQQLTTAQPRQRARDRTHNLTSSLSAPPPPKQLHEEKTLSNGTRTRLCTQLDSRTENMNGAGKEAPAIGG